MCNRVTSWLLVASLTLAGGCQPTSEPVAPDSTSAAAPASEAAGVSEAAGSRGASSARSNGADAMTLPTADSSSLPTADQNTEQTAMEKATLGAGCFWCIEAVLLRIKGVEAVKSGYMGGALPNPTYEAVCTGRTGHAEVVQVTFDPQVLSYEQLLEIFFQLHDPTTLNRQGFDQGTQYRSAVFFHSDAQRDTAAAVKQKLSESGKFRDPIVTEITQAVEFYPAEDYHQDYFRKNPSNPYCRANILPKLKKLGLLKDSD